MSEQDLVKYRKSIYLIVVSSIDFEECCHKLLKQNVQEGLEGEMVNMIIECCVQERTYLKFYGLLSERLCLLKDVYKHNYEKQFDLQYIKLHRLETNKLRNLANLYAHLLFTEAIDWMVLSVIKLTEDDTTASSRIFLKIMFQELNNLLGEDKLKEKMLNGAKDEYVGMFCRENPTNTRFCINFFTAIGLGYLTDDLRAFLDNVKNIYSNDLQDNNFSALLDEEKKENAEDEKMNENKEDEKNEKTEKKIDEDLEKIKEKIREKEKMREKLLESETEKEKYTNTEVNNSDENKSVRSSSISQTESSIISVESKGRRKGRSRKKKSEKGSISRSRRRMKSRSRSRSPTHKTTKTNKTNRTKRSKKSKINSSVSRVDE